MILLGDNLSFIRSMKSEIIDLIYLDPPFCTGRDFGAFTDRWAGGEISNSLISLIAKEAHSKQMAAYLSFMEPRLIEMKRLLKDTGSIYLHCDPTASHYLKLLMDSVFGRKNLRNEIVWCYTGPGYSQHATI